MEKDNIQGDLKEEEFPEKIFCPQCRELYLTKACRSRCNTLLTDIQLSCPRCRRRLRKMKMKDWYDHYVQGTDLNFFKEAKLGD